VNMGVTLLLFEIIGINPCYFNTLILQHTFWLVCLTFDLTMELSELNKVGFWDVDIDPALDLYTEIGKLKREKNAVILAHYYQEPDIQDVADYIGDSLGLAQKAETTDSEIIVFAGVHFMAETAKILNPDKKVLLPDLRAGCSLSDSCPPPIFNAFREKHPDHLVISYINCSAGIKALSDIICTSSNAQLIVESLPAEQKIIFAPDKNLGGYINKMSGRDIKQRHPDAKLIAHPECEDAVLRMADFVGSTTQLLQYIGRDETNIFIVATEAGILHKMQQSAPSKTFLAAPPDNTCACNDCPHMKLNTLEKLYLCMKYELPEIIMDEQLRLAAKKPIDRMLALSRKLGLG